MNMQSLFGKFRQTAHKQTQLTVVVLPHALFFSPLPSCNLPSQVNYDAVSWQDALVKALKDADVSDLSAQVVLGANLYQTYQIDKPSMPEEELSAALPFLLKDLISERVSDIIADFTPSPIGNKLQVFVVNRHLVEALNNALGQFNIELTRILVEDEVWAHSAGELAQFLLLHRSHKGQFKVSAFVDGQCAFQRTIRGVASPLTGVASSALQLDSLALELQRSVDYLSSQLRSASLHQMKVCCDEEDQATVATELSERLSVKASPLVEGEEPSGLILLKSVAAVGDKSVNLFPDHLKPKKEHFTLKNVALGWGITSLVLGGAYFVLVTQKSGLSSELSALKSQESEFRLQVDTLTQRLAKHQPTPAKVAAVARLEQEIESKRQSLQAVSEYDDAQQMGYSGVMRSLAQLGRNDISLHSITIDSTGLDLQGYAREPQVIPNWINQFKTELNLVGRTFEKLQIGRNDQDIVIFELKTRGDKQ
ncbi:MSHA biogenesis protein MshI [Vibrio sp. 16]|uniref:MSHA biogenesis protein MshI n=1 Tax=Vibrio sp. 16 TaxID=391586 RepID=UPI002FEE97D9